MMGVRLFESPQLIKKTNAAKIKNPITLTLYPAGGTMKREKPFVKPHESNVERRLFGCDPVFPLLNFDPTGTLNLPRLEEEPDIFKNGKKELGRVQELKSQKPKFLRG